MTKKQRQNDRHKDDAKAFDDKKAIDFDCVFCSQKNGERLIPASMLDAAKKDAAREIAAIAHDIMQPAQALSLFVDALQKEVSTCCCKDSCDADRFNTKVKVIVEKIAASSDSLHDLLSNIFRASSLDAGVGQAEISSFPMSKVLQKIDRDFSIIAEQKGLELKVLCKGLTVVDSDPIVVERILRNLLSNAIKYTEKGTVTVGGRRNEDTGKVTVYVNDTGIGIPKDKIPRIFDYFYRACRDDCNNVVGHHDKEEGIGIGLATVARLSRLLNTSVEVKSILGEGTEFYFDLPITPSNIGVDKDY
ncbi:MAG: HAMP domain-containing histidine kinase [Alphaproteobacteria bacterium]|nr:HAMP domain-containing histidine kinase [Alphaproteobacteria bacterium]